MKSKLTTACFLLACISLFLPACKKDNTASTATTSEETALQATNITNAADQTRLQADEDDFAGDAATAADFNPSFLSTAFGSTDTLTDATLSINNKKITIQYKGLIKSGTIYVELKNGASWRDAGAVLLQTFTNCTIKRNGKTFTYNGTRTVTNITGGLTRVASGLDSVVHKVRVSGTVTLDDNSSRTWWAARLNTYLFKRTPKVFKSEGDSTISANLYSMGGITRNNKAFLVAAPLAIVANNSCGWTAPTQGIRKIITDNRTATLTYGVNASGTAANGTCAYGYKIEWTKLSGNTGSIIIAY